MWSSPVILLSDSLKNKCEISLSLKEFLACIIYHSGKNASGSLIYFPRRMIFRITCFKKLNNLFDKSLNLNTIIAKWSQMSGGGGGRS